MNKTKLVSLIVALANIPLIVDEKIIHVPGMPAWISVWWPVITAVAIVIHQWASKNDQPNTPASGVLPAQNTFTAGAGAQPVIPKQTP